MIGNPFSAITSIAFGTSTYHYILVDCPPALDLILTLNALMAADAVLIPIQCEAFLPPSKVVSGLMDTIDRVRESFGHPLQIEGGILLTMYDERTNLRP